MQKEGRNWRNMLGLILGLLVCIGSRTRTYFWINAFVREFIATVYAEWKTHLKVIAGLILLTLVMVLFVCLSNIL